MIGQNLTPRYFFHHHIDKEPRHHNLQENASLKKEEKYHLFYINLNYGQNWGNITQTA